MFKYAKDVKVGMKVRYNKDFNNRFHKILGNSISPYNQGKKRAINEHDVLTIRRIVEHLWFTELQFEEIPKWGFNMFMFDEIQEIEETIEEETYQRTTFLTKVKGVFKSLVS